nr:hypothetical protein [Tanacetum cinerariifolium]
MENDQTENILKTSKKREFPADEHASTSYTNE